MSENPLQVLIQTFEKVSNSVQTHLTNLIGQPHNPSSTSNKPLLSFSSSSKVNPSSIDLAPLLQPEDIIKKVSVCTSHPLRRLNHFVSQIGNSAAPVTKEELGMATWTFLHTLAAQYPDNPTRQQKKDVKELMAILSRMYPCKECADHFKEILRTNPVQAGSHAEFSQWLCHAHNVVNRSLGKLAFQCERVDARWGKLECEQRACDLLGDTTEFGEGTYKKL
ncbi:FAD-linked sulfhydryl oxidase ERV1 isoform X1 [Carya illinoinensis]|uniref:FAD-linked sulfhydryl oxidase ERV1 isoform X1 n=1 Tax=Carya illinoinensis TaxID=32201 RepID=UPI001C71CA73|nr:FAD-linked sulfhydryl oxidase ERV1 isoform X1 [Carya illinoinensis]